MIDPITVLRAQEAGLPAAESNPDPPLACFPIRSEWEKTQPAVLPDSFPIPAVTSDDPVPDVIPGPVSRLVVLAESKGWTVLVTYSKGHEPHAKLGTPSAKPKVKWALRMVKGARRAVAVRTDDAWSSFWDWAPDQFFQRAPSLAAFERAL
jgi:hypothetical protein